MNENAVISEKECQNTGQTDGGKECTKSTTYGTQMAVHTSYFAEIFRNQKVFLKEGLKNSRGLKIGLG